uniref:Uncharacterized protein n=1 Tax=Leersia perrieri TaxID=77586 RepID=A0A0D9WVQ6_9ORYZ
MAGGDREPYSGRRELQAVLIFLDVLVVIVFFAALVCAIIARAAKTRRNKHDCRQLAPRVAFLRDLRHLMPPPTSTAAATTDIRTVLAWQLEACVKEAETLVCAIIARAAKIRRNKHDCRQAPRVAFLRDLQHLMPPPTSTAAATTDIRTVLARQLEACVKEAESIIQICTTSCCLRRFLRSYHHAGKVDDASKNVEHVYGHILPVVSQVDTAQRLLHLLELQVVPPSYQQIVNHHWTIFILRISLLTRRRGSVCRNRK